VAETYKTESFILLDSSNYNKSFIYQYLKHYDLVLFVRLCKKRKYR